MHNNAKKGVLALALAATASATIAQQNKPRVFINGSGSTDVRTNGSAVGGRFWAYGSSRSTISAHDQTMELAKDFTKQCPDVTVTLNATAADYTVGMNHEAFHGVVHKNDQVMVTNRVGDLVFSNATRAVSHSVNDSCSAIAADWKSHGPIEVPLSVAAEPASSSDTKAQVAQSPKVAPQTTDSSPSAAQPSMQVASENAESLGEIARRNRARKEAAQQQAVQAQPVPPPPSN
jgi:hypothetical protein